MAFKMTFNTPVNNHVLVFKKNFEKYSLEFMTDSKVISGDKETVLKAYKKFLVSIGFGSSYTNIIDHMIITSDFKFEHKNVYTFNGDE